MTVSLTKGGKVNLTKEATGTLRKLTLGLGWDAKSAHNSGAEFDLDASAFAVDGNDQVVSEKHFVFWGNLKSPEGAIVHTGDNLTGDGDGDDEQIVVDLEKLPDGVKKIIFAVTIYEGEQRKQNFGQVDNSFIRAMDDGGTELTKYELDMEAALETVVVFAELINRNGDWVFSANSSGFPEGFAGLCRKHGIVPK
jgi:tellurium resistance protein TerD